MLKLADIPKHTPEFWLALGHRIVNRIKKRVKKQHMNYMGNKFQPYSNKFSGVGWRMIDGRPVFLDSYKNRKKAGTAAGAGESQESYSTVPDMTLTGKTMADLQVRSWTKDHVIWGWEIFGDIVEYLHKMKNYQILGLNGNKILSQKEEDVILYAIGKDYDKKIDKYMNEDININIKVEI